MRVIPKANFNSHLRDLINLVQLLPRYIPRYRVNLIKVISGSIAMSNSLKLKSEYRCFDGTVAYYSHQSSTCNCEMNFAVYLPPQAQSQEVPILYYLSGLTCNEENFITKSWRTTICCGIRYYASRTRYQSLARRESLEKMKLGI